MFKPQWNTGNGSYHEPRCSPKNSSPSCESQSGPSKAAAEQATFDCSNYSACSMYASSSQGSLNSWIRDRKSARVSSILGRKRVKHSAEVITPIKSGKGSSLKSTADFDVSDCSSIAPSSNTTPSLSSPRKSLCQISAQAKLSHHTIDFCGIGAWVDGISALTGKGHSYETERKCPETDIDLEPKQDMALPGSFESYLESKMPEEYDISMQIYGLLP
ncbi:hypothetical protein B0O99DRAFT_252338 [Bisporella sp. PMI_857]|nr:hypothetical protein B0O99DRAFT_252338 [Bisporella sp. PMI_857]